MLKDHSISFSQPKFKIDHPFVFQIPQDFDWTLYILMCYLLNQGLHVFVTYSKGLKPWETAWKNNILLISDKIDKAESTTLLSLEALYFHNLMSAKFNKTWIYDIVVHTLVRVAWAWEKLRRVKKYIYKQAVYKGIAHSQTTASTFINTAVPFDP